MMRSAQIQKKGGQKQKILTRNSSLELLRIIAILMIVMHHCALHTNWGWGDAFTTKEALVTFFSFFGCVGVGIFFLISGYFMQSTTKFNWKRIFKIARPVWFYSFGFFIIAILLGKVPWGLPVPIYTLQSILPILSNAYWFIGAYIGIQLLFPFIKKGLDSLTQKQLLKANLITIGLFVIPITLTVMFAAESFSMLMFPSAFVFTMLGYTVHRFEKQIKSSAWAIVGLLLSLIIFVAAEIFGYFVPVKGGGLNNEFIWGAQSLPVILMALSLFIIFSRWRFKNKIINYIAGLTLGIYLIHDNVWVRDTIWKSFDFINPLFHMNSGTLHFLCYFFGMIFCVFIISGLIECVRQLGTKLIIYIMDKTKINPPGY